MSYKFAWEPQGLVIHFFGKITSHDPQNATVDYQGDSRFDDLLYVIADYSQIEECATNPPDIEDVWAIDSMGKRANPKLKKAIVTTNTEVIKMANHYRKQISHGFPVEVFATRADARTWIGVPTSE